MHARTEGIMRTRTRVSLIAPLLGIALLLCAAGLSGCKQRAKAGQPPYPLEPARKQFTSGEAMVEQVFERTRTTSAEHVKMTLNVTVPEGWEVAFPELDEKLGKFTVDATLRGAPALVADKRVRTALTVELAPYLPGKYDVPPLTIRFRPSRAQPWQQIVTKPVPVDVIELVEQKGGKPSIKDILPLIDRHSWRTWIVIGAVLLALAAAVAAALLIIRKGRKRAQVKVRARIPAHVLALRQLDYLLSLGLVERDEVKEFHVALSDILRRYIETRFRINAPDKTTEEFLVDLERSPRFSAEARANLARFLSFSDLVKFAAYRPAGDEIDEGVAVCRGFIKSTGDAECLVFEPDVLLPELADPESITPK